MRKTFWLPYFMYQVILISELVEEKDATANLPDNSSEVNLDQSSTSS